MNLTINFSNNNLLIGRQTNFGMLKSTQDKLQRQADRDGKIAFFEAQKENLKNMQSLNLDDIARKIEMLHSYDMQIAAAKQEYNNSQMFHAMDEAQERGEHIAKAAEKNKPKTEEERREETIEEALGTDEGKGEMSESLEELEELEELAEKMTEDMAEIPEKLQEEIAENSIDSASNELNVAAEYKKYVPINVRI